jgi:chromosomal replication initiation ATPase DnaA
VKQLVLDLSRSGAFGRDDFLVSNSNAAALAWIERWPDWPSWVMVLHGPQGAGKTHLAHLWRTRAAAIWIPGATLGEAHYRDIIERPGSKVVVDEADGAPETALLHLFNACGEAEGNLLLTSRHAPALWPVTLADLRSRVRASLSVGIDLPDDSLLGAVLGKHFADRQVLVAPEVILYLVRRMERSLAAAAEIAAALDTAALARGSAITIPLAQRVLSLSAA